MPLQIMEMLGEIGRPVGELNPCYGREREAIYRNSKENLLHG